MGVRVKYLVSFIEGRLSKVVGAVGVAAPHLVCSHHEVTVTVITTLLTCPVLAVRKK